VKKNIQTQIDASKKLGPEINIEKNKCMFISLHRHRGQITT
jgi:hypothetical protein